MKLGGIIFWTTVFSLFAGKISAQCEVNDNNFFKSGERLSYDLYFKYGIINSNAGNAVLTTQGTHYNGTNAYKMTLISHSSGMARSVFKLDDTLSCYMDLKLRPLAFLKDAHEGDEHTIERQTYSYQNGAVKIHARRVRNGVEKHNVSINAESCTYDLMSILYYARTLDYEHMTANSSTHVVFISGKKKVQMEIFYQGVTKVKANNGHYYNCHKLTLSVMDKAFTNKKEAMKVYITNDMNRIPVRLDSRLKVGSTRVMLRSYSGLKNPVE